MEAILPEGAKTAKGLRALVIDDIPEIGNLYRSIFKRVRGFDVDLTIETDPIVAIKRVRETRFDLVVSDFRMKGGDGIDVLAAAHASHPKGRRVLMTGYNEVPTSIERIRSAHIDAYVQKPLRTQDLLIMMNDLLVGDETALIKYRLVANELELIAAREERGSEPSLSAYAGA
jgi:DNA-binding NtrC family response regulator